MYNVSVIVPVYNVEEYLDECVQSLLNQTLRNVEIILVDDGSTDSSGSICDHYADTFDNVITIHQKNSGQSTARNNGILRASGKYVMFVDSDDYIVLDACKTFYEIAEKNNLDVIWGDMLNIPSKSQNLNYNKPMTLSAYLIKSIDNRSYDIVPVLKMVNRSFLIENNLFFVNGCFYEDQEYTLKMLLIENSRMMKIYFPFYYYRMREGSTTHEHGLKKGTDFIKVIRKMMIDAKAVRENEKLFNYAQNVIAMAVYHLSAVFVNMNKETQKKLISQIPPEIKRAALHTDKLSWRMKIQNRLFVYSPFILNEIFKIKRIVR